MRRGVDSEGDRPAASPTVVDLRARGREADRTEVVLSDERRFTVATEAVLLLGLSRDAPVDAHLEARLADADLRFRARDLVLGALSRRAHPRRELRDRLRRKGFPTRLIGEVLDELEAAGLVNDRAFAEAYVRDRVRLRPRGRKALVAELARKGVRDDAEEAIDEVFEDEGVSERALARAVAEGWLRRRPHKVLAGLAESFGSEAREGALRRYLGFMGRRGFGSGLAREVLEELNTPGSTTSDAGGRRL